MPHLHTSTYCYTALHSILILKFGMYLDNCFDDVLKINGINDANYLNRIVQIIALPFGILMFASLFDTLTFATVFLKNLWVRLCTITVAQHF